MPKHNVYKEVHSQDIGADFFQHGSFSIDTDSAGSASSAVTFSQEFGGTPAVMAMSDNSGDIQTTSVASSQVTIEIENGGSVVTHTLRWMATYTG